MFKELPAWGIYIRHASNIRFNNVRLTATRKDYRTAIVLDNVHESGFISMKVDEPGGKKIFYQYKSSGIVFK